jgi:single-strand DNA-binding protein
VHGRHFGFSPVLGDETGSDGVLSADGARAGWPVLRGGNMASFNKVILLGNLTRDPEMKFLPSGTPVVEFGIAMNRKWVDQTTKEAREAVTFVDCKAMGRQAEVLSQHTRKGAPLFVEGRLDYRQWEGPDGTKRSKLEVFVENFQFVGPPRESGADGGAGGARMPRPAARAGSGVRGAAAEEGVGASEVVPREDVPF